MTAAQRYKAERAKRQLPPNAPTKQELAAIFRQLANALDRDDEASAERLMAYLAAEGFALVAAAQTRRT